MKKYLNIIFSLIVMAFVFTSCDYEDDMEPLNYVTFGADGSIAVPQDGNATYDIKVFTGNVVGTARTFNISVNESTTLAADSYSVPSTITIPANSNEAIVTVSFSDTNISNAGDTLILDLEESADFSTGDSLTINVSRDCPSNLEGEYSVLTSGQSTDGAASDPVIDLPYTVTLTKTGSNSYLVSDIFAGIYIEWYCEPYGYCVDTESTITDTCGNISGQFEEPFGTDTTVTGMVNDDGTLTISFENGYGDKATSVYTRI